MHLSFPGLLALSHQHPWLHPIEFIIFLVGCCLGIESSRVFQKGRTRQSWYLAIACLGCLFLRNGTQISEWGWTIGMFLVLGMAITTQPKYDVKRYRNAPLAYLLFYWLGMTLVMMPISDYWYSPEHLFHHYQQAWHLLGIGSILLIIGGVLHYRAWQLPPPPTIQQKQEARTEKPHLV